MSYQEPSDENKASFILRNNNSYKTEAYFFSGSDRCVGRERVLQMKKSDQSTQIYIPANQEFAYSLYTEIKRSGFIDYDYKTGDPDINWEGKYATWCNIVVSFTPEKDKAYMTSIQPSLDNKNKCQFLLLEQDIDGSYKPVKDVFMRPPPSRTEQFAMMFRFDNTNSSYCAAIRAPVGEGLRPIITTERSHYR
jgi:hypothetical protein